MSDGVRMLRFFMSIGYAVGCFAALGYASGNFWYGFAAYLALASIYFSSTP